MLVEIITRFYPLIAAITAMLTSQIIKIILTKRSSQKSAALTQAGGMPSSHSALITAATLSIGLNDGFNSSIFFISVVLSLVVIYDARGIRHTVGKHAKLLNKELSISKSNKLDEQVGHTLPEISVGIGIGLMIAFFMYQIVKV